MGYAGVDNLIKKVRSGFERIKDHRGSNARISIADALMSGFALFALKDSSLLAFDKRRSKDENLKQIYQMEEVPCDSQMRTILDEVEPSEISAIYQTILRGLEQSGELEQMKYLGGYYLLLMDGTEYFSSEKVHCDNCLVKKKRNGVQSYHHQLLGRRWCIPITRKCSPWPQSQSSNKMVKPRMIVNEMQPNGSWSTSEQIIRT